MNGLITTDNSNLGEYLKSIRKSRGLSLKDVEKEIELSASYINRLENGNRSNPSMDSLDRLSTFYGISPEKVMKLAGYDVSTVRQISNDLANFIEGSEVISINGTLISSDLFKSLIDKCIVTNLEKISDIMDLCMTLRQFQSILTKEKNI